MAISVNYSSSPWLITIPKADLTLISGTKYQLTVDTFWQLLRDYADSEEGIVNPVIYTRIAATASTPSITEVNADYYSLQFEDGLYSVNIINGNTNIRDVEVKNQVSVATNNTTGFIDPTFLEAGLFGSRVTIDIVNGYPGTDKTTTGGIIGTLQTPSNNLTDAKIIASNRGFNTLHIINNITFTATDVLDGMIVHGENSSQSLLTFLAGSSTSDTTFEGAMLMGDLSGALFVRNCSLMGVTGIGCTTSISRFIDCSFESDDIVLRADNNQEVHFVSCENAYLATLPYIDINNSFADVTIRQFSGQVGVRNMTSGANLSFDSTGGHLTIDATCTAGTITIRGATHIIDNSGAGCTVIDESTATSVWSVLKQNSVVGTYGELLNILFKYENNRNKIDKIANTLTIYDDDDISVLKVFDLKDSTGVGSVTEVYERIPQ